MAVISFWNNGKEEVGKSSALIAVATYLGINHNYKILVLNTRYNDFFYQDCFWKPNRKDKDKKEINYTGVGEGIRGLSRAVLSNKASPEIVTNYTRIVFNNNRLEILEDASVTIEEYSKYKYLFKDIVKIANKFYDLVFLDIDKRLDENVKGSLLEVTDLVVNCVPQRLRSINNYARKVERNEFLKNTEILPVITRYDPESKYNTNVITKFLKQKDKMAFIPYNTLFFEACNEGKVADFFIKYRNAGKKDKNALLINNVRDTSERIVEKLMTLQKKV